MSGVAGGSRITTQDVEKTYDSYYNKILKNIPGFKKSTLTGSVKARSKSDYGDLDIAVFFEGDDKKEVKQRIIDYVSKQPDSVIVPFKSEKYAGKKYYNSGEIISILYPIQNSKDEFIQIDNIIALSSEELGYKESFLDLPAEVQGLLLGLAKSILLEEDPSEVFKRLGIKNIPKLEDGEEFEFNLSSGKLTLRVVKLDNFKEIGRKEIWSTTDWSKVRDLFKNYKIDGTFDELLSSLDKRLKNPRSRNRIVGTFKSMVTVKSGEVSTPKGDAKTSAISKVDQILTENTTGEVVALYAGGFKPPHIGHFNNAKFLLDRADKLIIFIGKKIRPGEVITPEQSLEMWKIYSSYINKPVEVFIGDVSPVKSLYDWVDNNQDKYSKVVVGYSPGEEPRYAYFIKNKDKYAKVDLIVFNITTDETDEKLSATSIRNDQNYFKSLKWTPKISDNDKLKILSIFKKGLETSEIIERMKKDVRDVLSEMFGNPKASKRLNKALPKEGSSGIPLPVTGVQSSSDRSKLLYLFNYLSNLIYKPSYNIDFDQDRIVITLKDKSAISYDYTPYMSSLLEYMINKGLKITPLPDIKLRKDLNESSNFFGRTAYYDPDKKEVVLYIMGRHPKDVMRSFSHEMIHHMQNLEGRLNSFSTTNVNEDDELMKIEEEAILEGNKIFRSWEDSKKNK